MSDVVVQTLTSDDWQVWRDVRLRALASDPGAFASTLDREQGFTEEDWRARVSGTTGPAVVALDAYGSVVACGGGWADGDEYHVVAMWTDPACRGTGVGSAVLRRVLELTPPGTREVRLCFLEGNETVQRFYEREGFRVTGQCTPLRRDHAVQKVHMVRAPQAQNV
jgi:ribosomal protein S18 acetylase RimI-like enzyme